MSKFENVTRLETQSVNLMFARAVLHEAEDYFESEREWPILPSTAEHILLLLQATNNFLFRMEIDLQQVIDDMIEEPRSAKQN